MTNEEFIQRAAKLLETKKKISADKLKNSIVRDAKIVCFSIGTDLNAMTAFDAETGHLIFASCGSMPLIPQHYAPARI
jgi:uncharacterized membrane protein